jgi:hypothetical protein
VTTVTSVYQGDLEERWRLENLVGGPDLDRAETPLLDRTDIGQ